MPDTARKPMVYRTSNQLWIVQCPCGTIGAYTTWADALAWANASAAVHRAIDPAAAR